jgi:2-oxoglutarate dehydrogenase E2 component (dihydrolipoamide succinyltransferase)
MADFNIVMPKLGESVQEATIIRWLVKPGDMVQEDDALLEIATDKVDSEIPSPVAGKVLQLLFEENALVPVGEIIAVINTEGKGNVVETVTSVPAAAKDSAKPVEAEVSNILQDDGRISEKSSGRFYSPLVMSISKKEKISAAELDGIQGTGAGGRVRKQDILKYIENGKKLSGGKTLEPEKRSAVKVNITVQPGDQIVEMDRMRKLIAENMVLSKQISPHVTNFVEADVTNLVLWRNKNKDAFLKKEKIKLTFMPAFVWAVAKALKEFPGINASVDGDKIILRKNINIGIAVALPSGNLIVPVIKNADQKSLLGLAVDVNSLAEAARTNKLSPDDIQGGTFTISNFGTFRNLTGTPIINQPQVAILATGSIEKKPAVIETPAGDAIAIRHKIMLSLTYDHRVVDGALGGMYLRKVADLLEEFDMNNSI